MLKSRLRLESLEDRTVPTANPVDPLTDPFLAPPADPTPTADTQPVADGTMIPLAPQPPAADVSLPPADPNPTNPDDPATPLVVNDSPTTVPPVEPTTDPLAINTSATLPVANAADLPTGQFPSQSAQSDDDTFPVSATTAPGDVDDAILFGAGAAGGRLAQWLMKRTGDQAGGAAGVAASGAAAGVAHALNPPRPIESLGKWEVKMAPFSSLQSGNGSAGLKGTVSFTPDAKLSPNTKSIRLIQVWRRMEGDQYQLFSEDDPRAEANKVTVRAGEPRAAGIPKDEMGWRVDYLPSKLPKDAIARPYYSEFFPDPNNADGSCVDGKVKAATLGDEPKGYTTDTRYEFETIAFDAQNGQVLGAVRWGYSLASDEKLNLHATALPVTELKSASASAFKAVTLFMSHYGAKF